MRLRLAAVGIAIGEAANNAREEGGNNRGPFIRKYLASAGFDVAAPWCAAFTYWCCAEAADFLGLPNPLEAITHRALVSAYGTHARDVGWTVPPSRAREGDLVAFHWTTGNHIGFLLERPPTLAGSEDTAPFYTIEGNTSPGMGMATEEREREGDGVFRKRRKYDPARVTFIRWDQGRTGPSRDELIA